jgi:single-strand DNA-binding protein
MSDTVIHMIGHAGTDVDYRQVGNGTDLSTFRLASTPRRFDRSSNQFVDGTTTWITVQCWRALAVHVRDAVRRGDPLVVIGKLRTEEWVKDDARHSRILLDALAVGHDLNRGVSAFRKAGRLGEPRAATPTAEAMPSTPGSLDDSDSALGGDGLAQVS